MKNCGYPSLRTRMLRTLKVDANGCWIWPTVTSRGYGQLRVGKRNRLAHIIMYQQMVGFVPMGLELDHLCRNRACINPDHLEPVPHIVNVHRGAGTKISAETAAAIIARRSAGESLRSIAKAFGINAGTVFRIKHRILTVGGERAA